jgi:hypothetical protein
VRPLLRAILSVLAFGPASSIAQGNCSVTFNDLTAQSGSCTGTVTLSNTFGRVVRLSSTSSQTTAFATPGVGDYNTGFILATGPAFQVTSNGGWSISISASATSWTGSGVGARQNKPITELAWSTVSGSGYTRLSGTGATVATSTSATLASTLQIFYKLFLGWADDTPGSYTLNVTYTVTSP